MSTAAQPGGNDGRHRTRALRLPAADGFPLAAEFFPARPAESLAGGVVIAPATGVPRGFYRPFAEYLAGRGLQTLTFDYRGIGGSRPRRLRGFEASMSDWALLDAGAMLDWLADRGPSRALMLVGHSFGGQGLALLPNRHRLTAALLVAVQSGYWGHWSGFGRAGMAVLWYLGIPLLCRIFGYFPARRLGLGQNLPEGVARQWATWGRDRDYLVSALDERELGRLRQLEIPIRAYSFSDDGYAPRRAVVAMLEQFPKADLDWRHLRPGDVGLGRVGHFGFFREQAKEVLWRESADWLLQRKGGAERPPPPAAARTWHNPRP